MRKVVDLLSGLVLPFLGLVVAVIAIPAEAAVANLAGWLHMLGVSGAAAWIVDPANQEPASMLIAAVFFLALIAAVARSGWREGRRNLYDKRALDGLERLTRDLAKIEEERRKPKG